MWFVFSNIINYFFRNDVYPCRDRRYSLNFDLWRDNTKEPAKCIIQHMFTHQIGDILIIILIYHINPVVIIYVISLFYNIYFIIKNYSCFCCLFQDYWDAFALRQNKIYILFIGPQKLSLVFKRFFQWKGIRVSNKL